MSRSSAPASALFSRTTSVAADLPVGLRSRFADVRLIVRRLPANPVSAGHHLKLPNARLVQRQNAVLVRRRHRGQYPDRALWAKLKWSTRRVVTPEEAGSSPVAHPQRGTCWARTSFMRMVLVGSIPISATTGLIPPVEVGSTPARRHHLGSVAPMAERLPCKEKAESSNLSRSTTGQPVWITASGSTYPSDRNREARGVDVAGPVRVHASVPQMAEGARSDRA